VLCRFIKSQLTGQSLINALDKGKDVNKPAPLSLTKADVTHVSSSSYDVNKPAPLSLTKADVRAAKIIKAISKGLSEGGDGSASTCTFGFVLQTVLDEAAATEWELEALLDHFHSLFASKPINESEVVAGRAYTGPLYFKMNGSLRFASKKFGNQEHLKGNSYTNLIYACASLLHKFSEISIIPPGRMVYRGMHGVDLPEAFKVCKEGGGRGGVDFGFLSTSTNEEVAVSYIGGKAMPVLFQFDVGDIDRGASLSFLSQYPNEDEVLIPPLSYLEVIGDPFFKHTDKGEVTVYPARINCNLKSQTIEEIKGHRQKEILAMLPYLDGALRRDMAVLVEALAADFKEKAEEKKLDELTAQILRDFDVLSTELATPGKMSWLNQDSNYKQSICEVIDFKNDRLSKLVKHLSADERYIPDPLTTGLHAAAREGRTKTVAALLSIGADIDAEDKAGSTAVELAKDAGTVKVLKTGGATMRPISDHRDQNNWALKEAKRKQACKYTAVFGKCNNAFCRKAKSDHYGSDHRCLDPADAVAAVWEAERGTNQLLIEYAVKGLTGGVLMALQAGANVNHKDSAGNTAVELAKDTQTIEVLKAGGATMPKMSDQNKNQLLIKYAKKGCTGGVLMTLQVGANVNHKDSYSETALHGQPKGSKMWIGATALIYAAREGHLDMVQALLNAGANVDAKTFESETALHKAAWQGRLGIVQALLNAGANVDAKNWAGSTALSKAKFNNHAQVAALLRGRGRAGVGFGRHSPP
jgi:ankyrin repeat protein